MAAAPFFFFPINSRGLLPHLRDFCMALQPRLRIDTDIVEQTPRHRRWRTLSLLPCLNEIDRNRQKLRKKRLTYPQLSSQRLNFFGLVFTGLEIELHGSNTHSFPAPG